MLMTINSIRVRLGSLVEKMCTDDFCRIYEDNVSFYEKDAKKVVISYLSESDAYIRMIAKSLNKADVIDAINRNLSPAIVFCVGLRYHLLSSQLMQADQENNLEVPAADEDFFAYMLIDYCEEPIDQHQL